MANRVYTFQTYQKDVYELKKLLTQSCHGQMSVELISDFVRQIWEPISKQEFLNLVQQR